MLLLPIPSREYALRDCACRTCAAGDAPSPARGIETPDLFPALKRAAREGRRLCFRGDPHCTPEGRAVAAAELAGHLARRPGG